ncbi:unnamed protein product [[Actinomadura] parvosata subsp. kistnae]|nr:unnamed protein product [Actinomadura parvosata subsp. kistnae]
MTSRLGRTWLTAGIPTIAMWDMGDHSFQKLVAAGVWAWGRRARRGEVV